MAKRRGNQEGSIFQTADGTWRAQIAIEGKRLSHNSKTRAECQAWLKNTIKQIDAGMSFNGANMSFGDFIDQWMKTIKENRREKTYAQYEVIVRKYIRPSFGNLRLRDLQPFQIEKYLTQKKTEGSGDRTCQMIYSVMHTALNSAVRKGLIGRNPLDAVEKPRVRNSRPKITLQPEQIQHFLISIDGERNAVLYLLAIVTGVREGEILGLKWSDVDWLKRHIKVQRQVYRIPHQGLIFSTPKTQSGVRTIAVGEQTLMKLQEYRERQSLEKESAGDRWKENDLVFPTVIGTPIDPNNLLKDFKAMLQKAGLPPMRFHDLRHTNITLLLNDVGTPVKEAQQRAGHASPSTTINIYGGQATSKMDEMVAKNLDELVIPVKVDLHR